MTTTFTRNGAAVLRLICAVAVTSNTDDVFGFCQPWGHRQGSISNNYNSKSWPSSSLFLPFQPWLLPIPGRIPTTTHCSQPQFQQQHSNTDEESQRTDTVIGIHGQNLGPFFTRMKIPDRGTDDGHAIFGVLHNDGLIERYEIWKQIQKTTAVDPATARGSTNEDNDDDDKNNVIVAFVSFGNRLNGHVGIVHGGILSLVVDDLCGFAFEAINVRHAVTANLNMNYRSPVPANTTMKITIQLERREGRKLYWTVQMTSLHGTTLYVEATSLYIIPRSHA